MLSNWVVKIDTKLKRFEHETKFWQTSRIARIHVILMVIKSKWNRWKHWVCSKLFLTIKNRRAYIFVNIYTHSRVFDSEPITIAVAFWLDLKNPISWLEQQCVELILLWPCYSMQNSISWLQHLAYWIIKGAPTQGFEWCFKKRKKLCWGN